MVKAGLALALTVFWWDSMPSAKQSEGSHAFAYALMLGREIGIGLLLAMLVGLLLVPARIAGSYIGQEIGVSMDPVTNAGFDQSTIVAMIFETFAVLLFFGLNLHHFMILFVHHSFASLQSLSFTELPTEDLVALTGKLPEFGLLIMAPWELWRLWSWCLVLVK
jgi:flagellar biosynthetic protein FliR